MIFSETFLFENSGATLAAIFPPPEIFTAGTKALSPWAAPEKPQVPHVAPHTPHSHTYARFPIPVPQQILKEL